MLMEQQGEGVPSEPPKLMDQVRGKLRVLHLAKRTEEAYVRWIVRFISFHRDRAGQWVHPENMSGTEVSEFLTHLAVVREVSASTQNQAFSALLFLYTKVLRIELKVDAVRAKTPRRLPTISHHSEPSLPTQLRSWLECTLESQPYAILSHSKFEPNSSLCLPFQPTLCARLFLT